MEADYYTRFSYDEVLNFYANYSFFVNMPGSNTISILNPNNDIDRVSKLLERYFRFGLPNSVVKEMIKVYKQL